MTQTTSSGTCLSVTSSKPATYDAEGFTALSFTTVGELESVGDLVERHKTGEFENLCSGRTSIIKGGLEGITLDVVCALDDDDAGQTLMKASRKEMVDDYTFCVTRADGTRDFFVGKVISAGRQYGTGTDVIRAPYSIALTAVEGMDDMILTVPA